MSAKMSKLEQEKEASLSTGALVAHLKMKVFVLYLVTGSILMAGAINWLLRLVFTWSRSDDYMRWPNGIMFGILASAAAILVLSIRQLVLMQSRRQFAAVKAAVGWAQVNLEAAKANLVVKKLEVTAEVRQKTRRLRERDAAKEVARLELQLAQQNMAVLQSQFAEGKLNLRDVEKARLEENEKWMAYLDANFQRQQAQLELLKTAGQLDKVWQ